MSRFVGSEAYHRVVEIHQPRKGKVTFTADVEGDKYWGSLKKEVKEKLASTSAYSQFERDVALWYGALTKPDQEWKAALLKRLFATLYYGGLLVHKTEGWSTWRSERIAIAASISHTARVTMQLPKLPGGFRHAESYWDWLWGDQVPQSRLAATHGVEFLSKAVDLEFWPGAYAEKFVKEVKGNKNVQHFGVNIALGGSGNIHMISGKTIRENGKHGHLYFAYAAPTTTRHGALLVATEQSAPIDRFDTRSGWNTFVAFFKGVPDQYGGSHSIFGGHNTFSATGGNDWTKDGLIGYGPDFYYDGMFLNITEASLDYIKSKLGDFDADMLGDYGMGPPREACTIEPKSIFAHRQEYKPNFRLP